MTFNGVRRRLPLPTGRRLIRDAGPPTWQLLMALIIGLGLAIVVASQPGSPPTAVAMLIPLVAVTIPAVADVTGWRIRLGMARLADEQRRRAPDMPRTPAAADRWLAKVGEAAPALDRASALVTAGRSSDARALIAGSPTETAEDRARALRMLAAIDGLERGAIDVEPALESINALPPETRTYQLLALAWSRAWVEAGNGRPWRAAFASASRGIRTTDVPAPSLVTLAIYQLLLSICFLAVLLGGLVLGWV